VSRIIAGSRGGRRLATPPGDRTRPTTDRVREALFSAIASWAGTAAGPADRALAGLAFCDLYAGSGAVGLEAASRGAAPVLLVESNRRTALVTAKNAADLGLPAEVRTDRVEQLVQHPAGRSYDVVFADPPYELHAETLDRQVGQLLDHGWLTAGGLLVLERSRRTAAPGWPEVVATSWSRNYGDTALYFGVLGNNHPVPDEPGVPT
jgi:16S rRNA (guanine966-N2)-methyltransferase